MVKRIRSNNFGLTLVEIVISVVLLSILLLLAIGSLRIKPTDGQSRGLGVELKGLLSQARSQASATGKPVGLVFPTNGGANPIVQGCAVLSGWDQAQVERQVSFEGNYPAIGIFIGQWSLPSPQAFASPTAVPGADSSRFNISNWLGAAMSNEAALVFLPSGELVSSGFLAVDNQFPLVVGSRLDASSSTLTGASEAYTVLASTDSIVRLEKGVLGGLVAGGTNEASSWTLASLTLPGSNNTQAPELRSVEVEPAPIDAAFAASKGAECIVQADGVITLRVEATDLEGGPLFCQWTESSALGSFSHQVELPMYHRPEDDTWTSVWHWRPPATAVPDDIFELTVAVRDPDFPATVASGVVVSPRVLIVDSGVVAFNSGRPQSSANPDDRCHVYTARYDGTDLKAIFESFSTAGFTGGLNASRDGRRIAISTDYGDNLKLISYDGAEVEYLGGPRRFIYPAFSRDSTTVYATAGDFANPSTWQHRKFSFDSAGAAIEQASEFPGPLVAWSPSGTEALIQRGDDVIICDLAGNEVDQVYIAGTGTPGVALDWNAQGIFFYNNSDDDPIWAGTCQLYRADDPTDWTLHTLLGTYRDSIDIGVDGQYVFHAVANGIQADEIATGASRLVLSQFIEEAAPGFNYGSNLHGPMYAVIRYLMCSR